MTRTVLQTVGAVNYLPPILVLAETVKGHMPDARLCALVTDASPPVMKKIREQFGASVDFVGCDDVQATDIARMREYYTLFEFNSACKALALDYQLRVRGEPECFFIDPDMFVLDDFTDIARSPGSDIVLTPHTFGPYPEDGELPSNMELITSGLINGGVIFARNSPAGAKAVNWLVRQTRFNWFVAPTFGLFGDQHWLALLMHFSGGTATLTRDPGINIAYWNLHERPLRTAGDRIMTGADSSHRARLFHFSGFAVPSGGRLTKHSKRRFDAATEEVLRELVGRYEQALLAQTAVVTRTGITGDLGFSRKPLLSRMRAAEDRWGHRFVEIASSQGLFGRFGGKIDRLLSSL